MIYHFGVIVIYLMHNIEGSFVHSRTGIPHDEAVDFCQNYVPNHRLVDDSTNHSSLSMYMKNINLTHVWMAFKRHKLRDWTWTDGTMASVALTGLDTSGRVCAGISAVDRSRRPMRCNYGGDHEGYICQNEGKATCTKSEPCFEAGNTTYQFDCGVNDFYTARTVCAKKGMTLAKMDTEEKVLKFAKKKGEFHQFALCSFFWIGLRMEDWQTGKKVLQDSYWQDGQPEYQGNCTVGQVTSDKVMWETANCNDKRVAVCESSPLPTVAASERSPYVKDSWIIPALTTLGVLIVLTVCGGIIFLWRRNKTTKQDPESSQEIHPDVQRDDAEASLLVSSQETTENNPTRTQGQNIHLDESMDEAETDRLALSQETTKNNPASTQSQTTYEENIPHTTTTMLSESAPLSIPESNAERSTSIPRQGNADHQGLYEIEAGKEETAESAAKYSDMENYLNRIMNNLGTTHIDLQVLSSTQTKQVYEEDLGIGSDVKFHNELFERILNIDLGHLKLNLLSNIHSRWNTFDDSASDNHNDFLDKIIQIKKKIPDVVVIIDFPKEKGIFDSDPWNELVNSCTVLTADQKTMSKHNKCQTAISVGSLSDLNQKKKDAVTMYAPVEPIRGSSGKLFKETGTWFAALVSAIFLPMYSGSKYDAQYKRLRSTRLMHLVLTDLCDQPRAGKKNVLLLNPWDIFSDKNACEKLINKHTKSTSESTSV